MGTGLGVLADDDAAAACDAKGRMRRRNSVTADSIDGVIVGVRGALRITTSDAMALASTVTTVLSAIAAGAMVARIAVAAGVTLVISIAVVSSIAMITGVAAITSIAVVTGLTVLPGIAVGDRRSGETGQWRGERNGDQKSLDLRVHGYLPRRPKRVNHHTPEVTGLPERQIR